jgi:ferritin-like metal-binding protein YciE
MAKAAGNEDLRAAFTSHLRETERHVQRLEQVFRTIGEPVRGKKCDGLMGIIEEGKSAMEELHGPVRDAALIAGAQRAEHYEIAAYGTMAYFAEMLGNEKAKDLLGQTLDEEKAADEKLSEIAKSEVNRDALMGVGAEEEEMSMPRSVRRSAASRAVAHDRTRGGVRGNAGGRRRSQNSR